MEPDERVRVVPVPTRARAPVDDDDARVRLGDEDVDERDPHRAGPDHDVVGLDP
jgi:hypothetical protein